jgi:hypothetical protein
MPRSLHGGVRRAHEACTPAALTLRLVLPSRGAKRVSSLQLAFHQPAPRSGSRLIRRRSLRQKGAGARGAYGEKCHAARQTSRRRLGHLLPFIALTLLLGCKELGIEAEPAPTSSGPSTEPLLANPNLKH